MVSYRWPYPAHTMRFGGARPEFIKAQRRGDGRKVWILKQGATLEALRPQHLVILPQKLDSHVVLAQAVISVPLAAQLGRHPRSVNGLHDCCRFEMTRNQMTNRVGGARLSQWESGWPSHCFRDWRVKEKPEAGSCSEKVKAGPKTDNKKRRLSLDRMGNPVDVTFPQASHVNTHLTVRIHNQITQFSSCFFLIQLKC